MPSLIMFLFFHSNDDRIQYVKDPLYLCRSFLGEGGNSLKMLVPWGVTVDEPAYRVNNKGMLSSFTSSRLVSDFAVNLSIRPIGPCCFINSKVQAPLSMNWFRL